MTIALVVAAALVLQLVVQLIRRARRRNAQLAITGVPAQAKIRAIAHESYDGEDRYALDLWISGPGLDPFAVTFRCAADSTLDVGDSLPARADPSTHHYSIPGRR